MRRSIFVGLALVSLVLLATAWLPRHSDAQAQTPPVTDTVISDNARRLLDEGRRVFRYETFGDEAYWGDTLKLHRAIAGAKLGGVGDGVSAKTALSVGLKVDVDAVPKRVLTAVSNGTLSLDDPAGKIAKAYTSVDPIEHSGEVLAELDVLQKSASASR